ncbi:Beta propeller domain protein [Methanocaldococcus lauensis]|nr:Beta propeller domain protein [Methanocaldococcus lauensis]
MTWKVFLLIFIICFVAFCGCTFNKNNNVEENSEFKVVPANEELFKEFVKKSINNNYYGVYNTLGGFKVAATNVKQDVNIEDIKFGVSPDSNIVERYSKTNVQVEGIDEADIIKTDGNYIYFTPLWSYIVKSNLNYPYSYRVTYIIKALPPESAKVINNISKGGNLYLYKDNLIIINYNKILNYNVSNPKNPVLKWEMDLNGSYVDSRVYNGKLYLIVSKNDLICPIIWNDAKINYIKYYIPIVPNSILNNFDKTYIISSIEIDSGKINNVIATSGTYDTTVYMSKNNIYFAYHLTPNENKLFLEFLKENSHKYFPENIVNLIDKIIEDKLFGDEAKFVEIRTILNAYFKTLPSEERLNLINKINKDYEIYLEKHWEELEKTGIMKIDINTFEVKSGSVPGRLINQFAMDEHNNYLRVATTIGNYWRFRDKMTNNIYVLDKNLNIVGKLTNLEKGERIYAVRFLGDKAFIITYKETDPLLVIDLKNPKSPKLLGELKIPGYSTYLHPIGDNKLIGIGKDDDGRIKISLFDVSNYSNPKELDKYKLPEYWSPALYNHHAFLWDEDKNIMVIPVETHAYIFKIENDRITMVKDDKHKSNVLRSLYINNYIYTFSNNEMHIIDENNWSVIKKVDFT